MLQSAICITWISSHPVYEIFIIFHTNQLSLLQHIYMTTQQQQQHWGPLSSPSSLDDEAVVYVASAAEVVVTKVVAAEIPLP